jgi:hypothetical protein
MHRFAICSVLFALSFMMNSGVSEELSGTPQTRTTFKLPSGDDQFAKPLLPLIDIAVDRYKFSRQTVRDYSCIVVRQERVNGQLGAHEFMQAKVRNRRTKNGEIEVPFSVHLKFLKPAKVQGREVLFVEGANDGEMLVRNGGQRFAYVTTRLRPNSSLALSENRYEITEFGIENLVRRLVLSAKENIDSNCSVRFVYDAKLNNRPCQEIVIVNNDRTQKLPFQEVRVFIDEELQLPIHYEAYDWPSQTGGEPELLERYTYLKVKTNNGFSDYDFDPDNPEVNVE